MSVTGQMIADKAIELCTVKKNIFGAVTGYTPQNIPYVANGDTLDGFDCQGLIEWVLRQLGITANYRGTNHMWRELFSDKGDIAYGVEKYGEIPIGACILICDYGTAPSGYKDAPDCYHIYLKIDDKFLLHVSSSNGKLMIRDFADKAIPNGGPTHYGLISGVEYGVSQTVDNASDAKENDTNTIGNMMENWSPRYSHLVFREGDKGSGTREIQTGLNRLGYGLQADGEFGPLTEAAVIQFQNDHGLKSDGVVGKSTWAALIRAVRQSEGAV